MRIAFSRTFAVLALGSTLLFPIAPEAAGIGPSLSSIRTKAVKLKQTCESALKKTYLYLEGRPSYHFHHRGEDSALKKTLRGYQDWIRPIISALNPFSLVIAQEILRPRIGTDRPTDPIFRKLWRTVDYEPSASEYETLRKYKAEEFFLERRAFIQKHWLWQRVQKSISFMVETAKFTTILFALNFSVQQAQGGMITVDDYLNDPAYRLKPNQVRLIGDYPEPHSAVQVGNTVYSFGQKYFYAIDVGTYLRHKLIAKKFAEKNPELLKETQEIEETEATFFQYIFNHLEVWTGWNKLDESVSIITIDSTVEKVNAYRRRAELHRGQSRYPNNSMVLDCSSMNAMDLNEELDLGIPYLIDASPAQTALYLGARKTSGDSMIGNIFQVAVEDPDSPYVHLARNAWLSVLESKFFISTFLFNQSYRAAMETKYQDFKPLTLEQIIAEVKATRAGEPTTFDTKPALLSLHPEYDVNLRTLIYKDVADDEAKAVEKIFDTEQVRVWKTDRIPYLREQTKAGKDVSALADAIRDDIGYFFETHLQEAEKALQNPKADFLEIVQFSYRIQLLKDRQNDLMQALNDALKSP